MACSKGRRYRLLSPDTLLPSQASLSLLYAATAKTQLVRLAPIIPTMNTGTISPSASSAAPVTLVSGDPPG